MVTNVGKATLNERITEDFVRAHFKEERKWNLIIEEQKSSDPAINKLLKEASKKGKGLGKPEFIIRTAQLARFLIVVECKGNVSKHESQHRDRPADFAVDGVLHYAGYLAKSYDVVAIAVSGQKKSQLATSAFRWPYGSGSPTTLVDAHGPVTTLRGFAEYYRLLSFDPTVRSRDLETLLALSRELHNYMRDYAKVSESEKPLLVSGILIALRDDAFRKNYGSYKPDVLPAELTAAIQRELEAAQLPGAKVKNIIQPYSFLATHPELARVAGGEQQAPLLQLTAKLDHELRPFMLAYEEIDIVGQFYAEFLRYAGGDKKGLGIVLTPRHITELFAKIANVGPDDTVVDTCCGTGGFLISAMSEMDRKAAANVDVRALIRSRRLVGVEHQPHMFALAASNMILRGDGKANLYQGSCFDDAITSALVEPNDGRKDPTHDRPNVGLINPPFSMKGEGLHELNFVLHMLNCLKPAGTGIAVLPMSCAIAPHPLRDELLAKHTLVAVMSLPPELFAPVGVVPCMMVFRAHQSHSASPQSSWFAIWRDDGFVKVKNQGRVDRDQRWAAVRDQWLSAYFDRVTQPGISISKKVSSADEWCAEAYVETDYSSLTEARFSEVVKQFAVFRALQEAGGLATSSEIEVEGEPTTESNEEA